MTPLQTTGGKRQREHRLYEEIVTDITTRMSERTDIKGQHKKKQVG